MYHEDEYTDLDNAQSKMIPETVSKCLDDFVALYDLYKRNGGVILTLNGAEGCVQSLANSYYHKGGYEMVKAINKKAADFLQDIYERTHYINGKKGLITMNDLRKLRKLLDKKK